HRPSRRRSSLLRESIVISPSEIRISLKVHKLKQNVDQIVDTRGDRKRDGSAELKTYDLYGDIDRVSQHAHTRWQFSIASRIKGRCGDAPHGPAHQHAGKRQHDQP